MDLDVLVVGRDEVVGVSGGGRGAAGHETVEVWGLAGVVEAGGDVLGEVAGGFFFAEAGGGEGGEEFGAGVLELGGRGEDIRRMGRAGGVHPGLIVD